MVLHEAPTFGSRDSGVDSALHGNDSGVRDAAHGAAHASPLHQPPSYRRRQSAPGEAGQQKQPLGICGTGGGRRWMFLVVGQLVMALCGTT